MTDQEFEAWLPATVAEYAAEHVRTGRWSEKEALEKSREEVNRLLPKGLHTPDHHLRNIVLADGREPVGMIWVGVEHKAAPSAFIYNIEIYPRFRRRGYSEQAMLKLEGEVRRWGLESIRLHVFGHNTAARPLHEKLGYEPTNIQMLKRL